MDEKSRARRRTILEILRRAGRGHIGSAFSVLEIVRVLYEETLRIDPLRPDWPDRDRFILSKGHGCLGLYVEMAERGFFPKEELYKFCASDGILGGHPEHGRVPGVEASTGSLGHGLAIGIGMALSARMDRKTYRTFVLMGDGECNEGSVWESALYAAKYGLDNLVAIVDYNKMQCYASTAQVVELEPLVKKWESFNFAVREVDGHDVGALRKVFSSVPLAAGRPSMVICHTIKGKGIPELENNPEWHHKAKVSLEELDRLMTQLKG